MEKTTTNELVRQAIDRFWESVPSSWSTVRFNLRSIASEHFDISVEQFSILRHIRKGSKSISELAEAKQISRPAISQAVDLLVDRGFISRTQSTQDRRWVDLELTQTGNDMLTAIFDRNSEWMESRLDALSPDELARLISGLEVLKKVLDN